MRAALAISRRICARIFGRMPRTRDADERSPDQITTVRVRRGTHDRLVALQQRVGASSLDELLSILAWRQEARDALDRLKTDVAGMDSRQHDREGWAAVEAAVDTLAAAADHDTAPWEVWWVQLGGLVDVEPAIVLGSGLSAQILGRLLVVPCAPPSDVQLPWRPALTLAGTPMVALCDELRLADRHRLQRRHPAHSVSDPRERAGIAQALRELITI